MKIKVLRYRKAVHDEAQVPFGEIMCFLLDDSFVSGQEIFDAECLSFPLDTVVSFLEQEFTFFLDRPFFITDMERGNDHDPGSFFKAENKVDYVSDTVLSHFLAGYRADGLTHAGIKEPHVIIDLGHRAYSTPGISSRDALLDGNRRADAPDMVDIRFFHPVEELAGV